MKQLNHPTFEWFSKNLQISGSGSYLIKGLRLVCMMFVLLGSAIFTASMSPVQAGSFSTSTFCSRITTYGGTWHCQTGDKDTYGWYDKTVPKHVAPISRLKIVNVNGNPNTRGRLTIYTSALYCHEYWQKLIGRGFIQINDQRFPTCYEDKNKTGYNNGASYLFNKNRDLVRIITNIRVSYGDTVLLKIYGSIYDNIPDDCRSMKIFVCEYPAISSGWVYAYARTGINNPLPVAKFYNANKSYNNKGIYDFLTISYSDMDLDFFWLDYYDFDDLQMTFGILH